MSIEAIRKAQAAREAAAKESEDSTQADQAPPTAPIVTHEDEFPAGEDDTIPEEESPAAHTLALEKGMPVVKAGTLRRFILRDGTVVKPTKEGYYIVLNQEIAENIEHFSKQWGKLEEVQYPETAPT